MSDIKGFVIGYLTGIINALERTNCSMISVVSIKGDLKDLLTAVEDMNSEVNLSKVENEAEIIESLGEEEGKEAIDYIARQKEIDMKFLAERFSNKAVLSFEGMEEIE